MATAYAQVPTTTQEYINLSGAPVIMLKIAECESRLRQFNDDGGVLRGEVNPKDVGIFQINEYYHLDTSRRLGMNIYTLQGNIAYALYLYKKNGTRDWNASKPCWGAEDS